MQEEFKIINYKGLDVTVSNLGKVLVDGKEHNWYFNYDGYVVCSLKIPNKCWRSVGIHILVANAFIPNPNNLPEINHRDYNRSNPRADNLEWITHADTVRYSKCNMPNYNGVNNPNYGNKILSKKYEKDKMLSKEKQGRPGIQNGRSRPIDLYYDDKLIRPFAKYIDGSSHFLISQNHSYFNFHTFIQKNNKFNIYLKQDYTCVFTIHFSFLKFCQPTIQYG